MDTLAPFGNTKNQHFKFLIFWILENFGTMIHRSSHRFWRFRCIGFWNIGVSSIESTDSHVSGRCQAFYTVQYHKNTYSGTKGTLSHPVGILNINFLFLVFFEFFKILGHHPPSRRIDSDGVDSEFLMHHQSKWSHREPRQWGQMVLDGPISFE